MTIFQRDSLSRVARTGWFFVFALVLLSACGNGEPLTSSGVAVGTPNSSPAPVADDESSDVDQGSGSQDDEVEPPDSPTPPNPPKPPVRWGDVQGFFTTCGSAGCHRTAGNHTTALRNRAEIKASFARVLMTLEDGSMPMGGTRLTGEEIRLFKKWRTDGFR